MDSWVTVTRQHIKHQRGWIACWVDQSTTWLVERTSHCVCLVSISCVCVWGGGGGRGRRVWGWGGRGRGEGFLNGLNGALLHWWSTINGHLPDMKLHHSIHRTLFPHMIHLVLSSPLPQKDKWISSLSPFPSFLIV